MLKRIILVILTLAAFYNCLRFGYIWTAYGHGGQIAGIPFALLMLVLTIVYFSKTSIPGKKILFAFIVIYFLTLAGFSTTIEVIRATKKDYFAFLYYEPGGYVNKIFLAWLVVGVIVFTVYLILIYSKNNSSDNTTK